MKISGVYKITNKKDNSASYIGISRDILTRWEEHISDAFNPKSVAYSYPLQVAIRLIGIDGFLFEILECNIYDQKILFQREQYYINYYDSINKGYNQYNSHNLEKIPHRKEWTENEICLLEKLILEGYSYKEIGERLHRTEDSINSKAGKLGIGSRMNNKWNKEKEKKMLDLRNQGITQIEASKILGFSKEAVKKRWHDIYSKSEGGWKICR